MTVTLSMLWIGAMALASTPEWIRSARDFVGQRAGTSGGGSTTAATRGGNQGGQK